jgi:hypothetical protein
MHCATSWVQVEALLLACRAQGSDLDVMASNLPQHLPSLPNKAAPSVALARQSALDDVGHRPGGNDLDLMVAAAGEGPGVAAGKTMKSLQTSASCLQPRPMDVLSGAFFMKFMNAPRKFMNAPRP